MFEVFWYDETVRRLNNTSTNIDKEKKTAIINEWIQKLRNSKFDPEVILSQVVKGIKTFERRIERANLPKSSQYYKKIHGWKHRTWMHNRTKKSINVHNWYNKEKDEEEGNEKLETGDQQRRIERKDEEKKKTRHEHMKEDNSTIIQKVV